MNNTKKTTTTNSKEAVKLPILVNKTSSKEESKKAREEPKKAASSSRVVQPTVQAQPKPQPKVTKDPVIKQVSIKMINIKQIVPEIVEDVNGSLRESGKSAFIVDTQGLSRTFLRYSANYFNCGDPTLLQEETLRKYIIGAIRLGKVLAIDLEDRETTLLKAFSECCEAIQKDLYKNLCSGKVLLDEMYLSLVKKDIDGPMYERYQFDAVDKCKFVFIGSSENHSNEFLSNFTVYKIQQQ